MSYTLYSAAVQNAQTFAPDTPKAVVRNVVEEEGRSLMVFGLPEEANENLCDKVAAVLQEIGEKPRIEAREGEEG